MASPSKYSPDLRRRAIGVVIDTGRLFVDVARVLGIGSAHTLRRWVKQPRRDAGLEAEPTGEERAEIKRPRTEVAEQQPAIEILKAATTFFPQELDPRHR